MKTPYHFQCLSLIAFIATTFIACSGSQSEGPSTTPEGGDTPPTGSETASTPTEICEVVARGMCEAMQRCCPGMEERVTPEQCAVMVERCQGQFGGSAMLRDGQVRIDEQELRRVQEIFTTCDPTVRESTMPEFLVGTLGEGASCAPGESRDSLAENACAPGLYCNTAEDRVCQPLIAEGESCPWARGCADGLVCRLNPEEQGSKKEHALGANPDPFFCLPPVALGGHCETTSECAEGVCTDNRCVEGVASPFYCPNLPQ